MGSNTRGATCGSQEWSISVWLKSFQLITSEYVEVCHGVSTSILAAINKGKDYINSQIESKFIKKIAHVNGPA